MKGRFIAVVGPSGVGKDSVMEAMAASDPRISLAQRVITRPSDVGGEIFEGVTEDEFLARQAAGKFALSWVAHGLHYAIPISVKAQLQNGQDVLANLSRNILTRAQDHFTKFEVINLTASHTILSDRLATRSRETTNQIADRLDRAFVRLPDSITAFNIDNSGALEGTVQIALGCLYPVKA